MKANDSLRLQRASMKLVDERLRGSAQRLREYEQAAARVRSVEAREDVIGRGHE